MSSVRGGRLPIPMDVNPTSTERTVAESATTVADTRAGGHVWTWVGALLVLAIGAVPLVLMAFPPPGGRHYWGGVWYAPDDSLLLQTMWQGVRGHWLRQPPYAFADGPGAFFYGAHLLLGHLCGVFGWDPAVAYHAARIACAGLLLGVLYRFTGRFFDDPGRRRLAFFGIATGCGLGWVVVLARGYKPVEFTATEAYPFFAMAASLHLTLAIAALLVLIDALVPRPGARAGRWAAIVAATLVLAATQPFGSVLALVVGGVWALREALQSRRVPWTTVTGLVAVVAITAPFAIHQFATIAHNPAYVGWRTQVRTPTPPAWELLCAIGLAFPLALIGMVTCARRRSREDILLLAWVGAMVVLMALPWYQSRRFDLAGYVPFGLLAVHGIVWLRWRGNAGDGALAVLVNGLSSAVIVGAAALRVMQANPEITLAPDTWRAVLYLRAHAPDRAVVLARPLTSLGVLASTPLRVVYGHPAETPNAAATHTLVTGYFAGAGALPDPVERRVDYVLVEPPTWPVLPAGFREVFASGSVRLYAAPRTP